MSGGPATTTTPVVDCAQWMAECRTPHLLVPTVAYPAEVRPDAGWRVRVALLGGVVDTGHPDLVSAQVTTWAGAHGPHPPAPDPTATAHAALLVGQGRSHVHGLVPSAHLLVAPVHVGQGRAGPVLAGRGHQDTDKTVARAVGWAVTEGAHVLVLPFGRRRMGRRLAVALRRATAAGAIVFAAAGDLGPREMAFPASVTGVTAVTAYDDDGILPRCSHLADLAAPGRDVPDAGTCGAHALVGSAPATVLAAGAHAARRSKLTLELFGSVHGTAARAPDAERREPAGGLVLPDPVHVADHGPPSRRPAPVGAASEALSGR